MATKEQQNSYVSLLPEVFQQYDTVPSGDKAGPTDLQRLMGIIEPMLRQFEALLDSVSDLFDPLSTTREDFLPWLASWTALVLRADWSVEQKRKVLSQVIPLYRKRGTKPGLEEYLKIYVGEGVSIPDDPPPMQVGYTSTVGANTIIGGLPAHFFAVNVVIDTPDPNIILQKIESIKAVLDIEKPAHTYYKLNYSVPTFQVGVQSTVGVDTLI